MNEHRNETIRDGLLRWLLAAILVLGLISFSGSASEPGAVGLDRTRTELRSPGLLNRAKTVPFNNFCADPVDPLLRLSGETRDFTSYLFEFGSNITIQLKRCVKVLTTIKLQTKRFVKFYSNANSGDSDGERTRG